MGPRAGLDVSPSNSVLSPHSHFVDDFRSSQLPTTDHKTLPLHPKLLSGTDVRICTCVIDKCWHRWETVMAPACLKDR